MRFIFKYQSDKAAIVLEISIRFEIHCTCRYSSVCLFVRRKRQRKELPFQSIDISQRSKFFCAMAIIFRPILMEAVAAGDGALRT